MVNYGRKIAKETAGGDCGETRARDLQSPWLCSCVLCVFMCVCVFFVNNEGSISFIGDARTVRFGGIVVMIIMTIIINKARHIYIYG